MKIFYFILKFNIVFLFLFSSIVFSAENYPLEKGTKWEYSIKRSFNDGSLSLRGSFSKEVIENPYKIGDINTVLIKYDNGNLAFFINDQTGIYKYASQKPNEIEPSILNEKEIYYLYPLRKGTSWKNMAKPYLVDGKDTEIEIEVYSEIENELTRVITEAGSFENCIVIKSYGKRNVEEGFSTEKKTISYIIEIYSYLAPDVGWVKSIINHFRANLPTKDEKIAIYKQTAVYELKGFHKP